MTTNSKSDSSIRESVFWFLILMASKVYPRQNVPMPLPIGLMALLHEYEHQKSTAEKK